MPQFFGTLRYRLFWDAEDEKAYNEVHFPSSCFTFRAWPLVAGTLYRFQVLAMTAAGEGPHTPLLAQRTIGGAVSTSVWARRAAGIEEVKLDDYTPTLESTSISGRAQPKGTSPEPAATPKWGVPKVRSSLVCDNF